MNGVELRHTGCLMELKSMEESDSRQPIIDLLIHRIETDTEKERERARERCVKCCMNH